MFRNKITTSGVAIIVIAVVGFLGFDWYNINKMRENPDKVQMYSWSDENGEKHFTNTYPPLGAKNIVESEGVAYVRPPLAIMIKNKAMGIIEKGQNFWSSYSGD
jgi:hypothetical protein